MGHWKHRALAAALALQATPLFGATPAELDALARATEQPADGIALARRQLRAGDMLESLATIERVILNHPRNDEARLLHAALLCRLDDRLGATVELDTLRGRPLAPGLRAELDEACNRRGAG